MQLHPDRNEAQNTRHANYATIINNALSLVWMQSYSLLFGLNHNTFGKLGVKKSDCGL